MVRRRRRDDRARSSDQAVGAPAVPVLRAVLLARIRVYDGPHCVRRAVRHRPFSAGV